MAGSDSFGCRRVPGGEVCRQVLNPLARLRWGNDFQMIGELEELAHRFDVGVAQRDGAPAGVGRNRVNAAGAEDAPREVEAVLA